MKFDLASFKKIRENETHATFQHPQGHEIHISKSALNPAMQKQLSKLPMHFADGGDVPGQAQPDLGSLMSQVPAGINLSPSDVAGISNQQMLAPTPEAPSPQAQPQALGTPYTAGTIDKTFDQMAGGLKTANQGMQDATSDASLALAENQDKAQDLDAIHQDNLAQIQGDLDKDRDAYMNQGIDPHHVWNSKSGVQKASTLIGMVLGGIGGALTHQENPAMKLLNSEIDRDVESQKLQLGKAHTLYSMNLQKYQNENAAYAATKLQMQNALQAQMQMSGLKMQSAQAQGNLAQGLSALELQKLPYKQQLAQFATMQQANQSGIPAGSNAEMFLPKDFQERLVNVKGQDGKMMKVPAQTKEDAEKFKGSQTSLDTIEGDIKRLSDLNQNANPITRHIWGTTDRDRIAAAAGGIKTQLAQLHGLSRLTDTEMHEYQKMVPDEGTWNTEKGQALLNDLLTKIQHKRGADAKELLSNYNPGGDISFKPRK